MQLVLFNIGLSCLFIQSFLVFDQQVISEAQLEQDTISLGNIVHVISPRIIFN